MTTNAVINIVGSIRKYSVTLTLFYFQTGFTLYNAVGKNLILISYNYWKTSINPTTHL